jgi:hypothetical protein
MDGIMQMQSFTLILKVAATLVAAQECDASLAAAYSFARPKKLNELM